MGRFSLVPVLCYSPLLLLLDCGLTRYSGHVTYGTDSVLTRDDMGVDLRLATCADLAALRLYEPKYNRGSLTPEPFDACLLDIVKTTYQSEGQGIGLVHPLGM